MKPIPQNQSNKIEESKIPEPASEKDNQIKAENQIKDASVATSVAEPNAELNV